MTLYNEISPRLFTLTKDEQLEVGNQLVALFKTRLKSWSRLDQLVNCEIRIDDLIDQEKIDRSEIELITKSQIQISSRVSP